MPQIVTGKPKYYVFIYYFNLYDKIKSFKKINSTISFCKKVGSDPWIALQRTAILELGNVLYLKAKRSPSNIHLQG